MERAVRVRRVRAQLELDHRASRVALDEVLNVVDAVLDEELLRGVKAGEAQIGRHRPARVGEAVVLDRKLVGFGSSHDGRGRTKRVGAILMRLDDQYLLTNLIVITLPWLTTIA